MTATVTSPPYGALKDYGQPNQIGWSQTYEQYLSDCRSVLSAISEVTRDDGTLWLVAGSLHTPNGQGGPSQQQLLPFDLAHEAAKAGWTLRDTIIWHKDRSVPWSGPGRLRNVFEYVLQFVKTAQYKYNIDRIRNPAQLEEWWVRFPERYHPYGKVPANVWSIPITRQGAWRPTTAAHHACPLPGELIERLILLSTDKDDVVLDTFAGIGTVVAHAERLGRKGLGLELNPSFVADYWKHVRPEVIGQPPTISDAERIAISEKLGRKLVTLRILKLGRVLYESARTEILALELPTPSAMAVLARLPRVLDSQGAWAVARVVVASTGRRSERKALQQALVEASSRRPASKFGIEPVITVVAARDWPRAVAYKWLYRYPNGRTWKTDGRVSTESVLAWKRSQSREAVNRFPPIFSNLSVSEDPRPIG